MTPVEGYPFAVSRWEFTQVNMDQNKPATVGIAISRKDVPVCFTLTLEDAKQMAISIMRGLEGI